MMMVMLMMIDDDDWCMMHDDDDGDDDDDVDDDGGDDDDDHEVFLKQCLKLGYTIVFLFWHVPCDPFLFQLGGAWWRSLRDFPPFCRTILGRWWVSWKILVDRKVENHGNPGNTKQMYHLYNL